MTWSGAGHGRRRAVGKRPTVEDTARRIVEAAAQDPHELATIARYGLPSYELIERESPSHYHVRRFARLCTAVQAECRRRGLTGG